MPANRLLNKHKFIGELKMDAIELFDKYAGVDVKNKDLPLMDRDHFIKAIAEIISSPVEPEVIKKPAGNFITVIDEKEIKVEWEKFDELQEVLHLTGDTRIYIGQYYDNSKTWQVGYESDLIMMFECEKRFRNKLKCREYVEKKVIRFAKQLNKMLDTNAQDLMVDKRIKKFYTEGQEEKKDDWFVPDKEKK